MTGFILVDGNAVGHTMHNGTTLTVGSFQTQAAFGFVKAIRELYFNFPDRRLIVLWDGKAQWRYDLFPDYKSNRDKKEDPEHAARRAAYKAQVPFIQAMMERLGVEQKLNYGAEADDLAGYLTPRLKVAGPVLLVTGDRDWWQLVGPNVTWWDPRDGRKVTADNFLEHTSYHTPDAFLDGKCLQGDTSDCIPGVGGIGQDTAPKFIAEFGSVANFWSLVDSGRYKPKARKSKTAKTIHPEQFLASKEGRERFSLNTKLMNLLEVPPPAPELVHRFKQIYDPEGFRAICQRLAFMSIMGDFDNFVRPFKERAQQQQPARAAA